jgi:hypothetical protein
VVFSTQNSGVDSARLSKVTMFWEVVGLSGTLVERDYIIPHLRSD